jgi:hypothetical protein
MTPNPRPDPRPRHPGQDDRWTRKAERKTNPDRRVPVIRRG